MGIDIIKLIIAGILFGSLFLVKQKYRWIIGLILIAYLIMIGAKII